MTTHLGLIGGGNITGTHAARAIPCVEISAIHGTDSKGIAHICHEHGGTPYQDFGTFRRHRPIENQSVSSTALAQGRALLIFHRKSPAQATPTFHATLSLKATGNSFIMNTDQAPVCALSLYILLPADAVLGFPLKDFGCGVHFLEVDLSQYIENSQRRNECL